MGSLAIRSVQSSRDEKIFIRFQWKIYRGNPYWVPPLLMDRKKLIDRKKNPFYKHARMELFLAERDGDVVGRIGAIVNDNHNKEHEENIGFFGFFECIDDQSVADALFDAARKWLKTQGVTAIRGPASPSVNDEYGLLIDGFDKPPAILMAYNPAYYRRLVENYGFTKLKDLYAYYVHEDRVFGEKLTRVAELVKKRGSVVFRTINMKDFDNEVKIIRELYNRGWESNWGEVPMTQEEFAYVAKDLKAIVDPRVVLIAESKGKPVGFSLSLPDYNIILKDNRNGYLLPAIIRMFLFKKRINFMRIIILGVLPEYANSGIGGALLYAAGKGGSECGYFHGEASWVLEDNIMMNRGAEMMSAQRYKTYAIYQMPV